MLRQASTSALSYGRGKSQTLVARNILRPPSLCTLRIMQSSFSNQNEPSRGKDTQSQTDLGVPNTNTNTNNTYTVPLAFVPPAVIRMSWHNWYGVTPPPVGFFAPNLRRDAAQTGAQSTLDARSAYAIQKNIIDRARNPRVDVSNRSFVPRVFPSEGYEAAMPTEKTPRARKFLLPVPQPIPAYMAQASLAPEVVDPPERKLVVLDLNGTIIFRKNGRSRSPKDFVGRPFLNEFLQYLFDHFDVMIWSSAQPRTVEAIVRHVLPSYGSHLVAQWARDTLNLPPEMLHQKVQTYKNLAVLWASDEVQRRKEGYHAGKRWDQSNTILIDDSALKASAQPYNLLQIPEYKGQDSSQDVLSEVAGYLELLKMQSDISRFIRITPFNADGTWAFDWELLRPGTPTITVSTDFSNS